MAEELDLVGQPELLDQPPQAGRMPLAAAAGQPQRWRQAALAQQRQRPHQAGMVLLARVARAHQECRRALRIRMPWRVGVGLEPDAVADRQQPLLGKTERAQVLRDTFRDADDAVGAARQPVRLRESPARITFARVVFDMDQVRHARDQPGIAPPQVLAEAVRHQHRRTEAPAHCTSAAMVAACDQPGTVSTGTPSRASASVCAGSAWRLRRSTSSGSVVLPDCSAARTRSTATWVRR